jgi:hypothetical protein
VTLMDPGLYQGRSCKAALANQSSLLDVKETAGSNPEGWNGMRRDGSEIGATEGRQVVKKRDFVLSRE